MKMIRVYSVENCPYCSELKELLIKENIEFEDINVNLPENEAEFNKLFELTQCNDVPMVKIGYKILVPNVSYHSISELHQITKKLILEG